MFQKVISIKKLVDHEVMFWHRLYDRCYGFQSNVVTLIEASLWPAISGCTEIIYRAIGSPVLQKILCPSSFHFESKVGNPNDYFEPEKSTHNETMPHLIPNI